jgi:transketolase
MKVDRADLSRLAVSEARLRLLKMHYESGVGHIGGNLSVLDILMCLHHNVLGPNDAFALSKGHAAGALYITLWSLGRLTEEDLQTFHQDGTRLSGHPPFKGIPEIIFATGSLGHGLPLAAGMALGKKLKGEPGRVFCVTSDGEWDEGSNWEALIFARHHRLDNLTIVVDTNGLQGFGSTREVADLHPFADKFRAFGLAMREIDGHDLEAITAALQDWQAGPGVVIAHTKKGCGVSFMEGKMEWHYLPLSEDQYSQAVEEVSRGCAMSYAKR